MAFDEADNMCPNCVTPWKCNGPHLFEETVAAKRPPPETRLENEDELVARGEEGLRLIQAGYDKAVRERVGPLREALDRIRRAHHNTQHPRKPADPDACDMPTCVDASLALGDLSAASERETPE